MSLWAEIARLAGWDQPLLVPKPVKPHSEHCACGHLKGRHQLTNLGHYTHCADCGCERFT